MNDSFIDLDTTLLDIDGQTWTIRDAVEGVKYLAVLALVRPPVLVGT